MLVMNFTRVRRFAAAALTSGLALMLAACSSNSSSGGGGGGNSITIAFQAAPPSSLMISGNTVVTAVVQNDSTSDGVDWLLKCTLPSGVTSASYCGSLTSPGASATVSGAVQLHTASGAAVTYTAPATINGTSLPVYVTAFASADRSKNTFAQIAIQGLNNALQGTYVFQVLGATFNEYQLAGVFVADGAGNVTRGELTYGTPFSFAQDTISGGSYSVGVGGTGTLSLVTADSAFGNSGTGTLEFTLLSNSRALITEADIATGSGTLDLQTSTAAPSGGYAFVASGADINGVPVAFGGVANIDSPGTISGNGSVADEDDGGAVTTSSTLSGTVSTPDPLGQVEFNLTAGFATSPIQLTGYIVDSTHIKLVESDAQTNPNTGVVTGFGATGGMAIGQGAATGSFVNNANFSASYAFGILGQTSTSTFNIGSSTWAGMVTADGAGGLNSGYIDEDEGGAVVSDSLSGTYSVDSTGTGRATTTTAFGTSASAPPNLIFYLTGAAGSPALVLDAEASALGAGLALPQNTSASFNGTYGVNFTVNNGQESDGVGQISAVTSAGTLSGNSQVGGSSVAPQPVSLAGTFGATATPGRLTGTLSGSSSGGTATVFASNNAIALYLVDSTQGWFIENDGIQSSLGYFVTQTSISKKSKVNLRPNSIKQPTPKTR